MTHETHTTPPEDLPYDYNEYMAFSPFGAEALMQEQRGLGYGEDAPKEIGAFTKAFIKQDPGVTEQEVAQRLHGPRVSPEGNDVLAKLEMNARSAQLLAEGAEKNTHDELEKVRSALSALSDFHVEKLEASFTRALVDDETGARELFSRGNSDQKKWIDWIMISPENGGASDEQLKNVLQWNEYQFRKINSDPRNKERLKLLEQCYEMGLVEAVAKGDLHKQLLDNYDTQPKPEAVIADPLSLAMLGNHGFIYEAYRSDEVKGRSMILEQGWDSATYIHERTHTLGRVKDRLTNEPLTDLVGEKIHRHSPVSSVDPYESTYTPEEKILDAYMAFAGVDTYEASKFYAERDSEGLTKRLGDGLKEGDYVGSRQKLIDQVTNMAKLKNIPASEHVILGSVADHLQMLKQDILNKSN